MSRDGLAEYIADHYGHCEAPEGYRPQDRHKEVRCACLRSGQPGVDCTGWLGTKCQYWFPVPAKNWDDMLGYLRNTHD